MLKDPYALIGFVEIEEARKALPYTITHVGDASALAEWRIAQAAKEIDWQIKQAPKRSERLHNAISAVAAQDGRASKEVLAKAESVRQERALREAALAKPQVSKSRQVYVPQPEPTSFQKAVRWLKGLVS